MWVQLPGRWAARSARREPSDDQLNAWSPYSVIQPLIWTLLGNHRVKMMINVAESDRLDKYRLECVHEQRSTNFYGAAVCLNRCIIRRPVCLRGSLLPGGRKAGGGGGWGEGGDAWFHSFIFTSVICMGQLKQKQAIAENRECRVKCSGVKGHVLIWTDNDWRDTQILQITHQK